MNRKFYIKISFDVINLNFGAFYLKPTNASASSHSQDDQFFQVVQKPKSHVCLVTQAFVLDVSDFKLNKKFRSQSFRNQIYFNTFVFICLQFLCNTKNTFVWYTFPLWIENVVFENLKQISLNLLYNKIIIGSNTYGHEWNEFQGKIFYWGQDWVSSFLNLFFH